MIISLLVFVIVFGVIQVSHATTTYSYVKVTSSGCCKTENEFDQIGGLQKDEVTHDECRGNCTKYDWCNGIRITYEGDITGKRKKRGVHSEKCRLLTPGADITLDGWTHYNANRWAEWKDWKECASSYSGYNCYRKKASISSSTTSATTTTTTASSTTMASKTTFTETVSTTTKTVSTTLTPPIFCGPDATPNHVTMCSLCNPYNAIGCKGDCKWSALSTCVPVDYIDCGMKNYAEECSLCTPYDASGCAADCKWSKASTCIPVDFVHCGNMIYAENCEKCPVMTGMANETGCGGDCKWSAMSTCVPVDYIDCGMKSFAESCTQCTPYNASGCATDCKWSKASTCIPVDFVYCRNMIYADTCSNCPLFTGITDATGCETADGDCMWMDYTSSCAPRGCQTFDDCKPLVCDNGICKCIDTMVKEGPEDTRSCQEDPNYVIGDVMDRCKKGHPWYPLYEQVCAKTCGLCGPSVTTTSPETTTPDPLADAVEKLCVLMEKYDTIKSHVYANAEKANMNKRRHQNVDLNFNKLCPLIDEIYDVTSPPGGKSYDCCYESFKEGGNAKGRIGQSLMCQQNVLLNLAPIFPQTPTGFCATTCENIPVEGSGVEEIEGK